MLLCTTLFHQGKLPLAMMLWNPDYFWFLQSRHLSPPAASACFSAWQWTKSVIWMWSKQNKIADMLFLFEGTCFTSLRSQHLSIKFFTLNHSENSNKSYSNRRKVNLNKMRYLRDTCFYIHSSVNWQHLLSWVSKTRSEKCFTNRSKNPCEWKEFIWKRFKCQARKPLVKGYH